ncbi:unnamed protein product [Cuscuta epithymum]|uniref:Replication protein A 70 kDa DNA-binding subunit B/D first OB fold domain-containing protein n=1 Tax=Cuscuta epithymum TaxID=186058 RepID=A0AAV0CMY5_9ASTE|nr:unnamed protein product [Cuscuta epithymum]CAH9127290.1 unnamed protein product [Cuscuta epithymum]
MPPVKKIAPVKLLLANLTTKSDKSSAIIVRIIRKWNVPMSRSVELLLQDDQGSTIQATIEEAHVPIFDDQIEEGKIYAMVKFTIQSNVGTWRPSSHDCRLRFTATTKVKLHVKDNFDLSPFEFKSFKDIMNAPKAKTPDLFDVIGAFDPRVKPNHSPTVDGKTKWCNFNIRNLENLKIHCTLWDSYADAFLEYLKTPRSGAVVVLLQLCRLNARWGGVSTSYHATKLLIDENIPEIKDFRARFSSLNIHSIQYTNTGLSGGTSS